MKNFVKLFFTVLIFFLSLATVSANDFVQPDFDISTISAAQIQINIDPGDNEKYITAVNNQGQEIFANNQKKDDQIGGSFDKVSAQNKSVNKFFNSKYNKINNKKSYKFSTYLSSEICTRAP